MAVSWQPWTTDVGLLAPPSAARRQLGLGVGGRQLVVLVLLALASPPAAVGHARLCYAMHRSIVSFAQSRGIMSYTHTLVASCQLPSPGIVKTSGTVVSTRTLMARHRWGYGGVEEHQQAGENLSERTNDRNSDAATATRHQPAS